MATRFAAARMLNLVTFVTVLVILWQIVRFCQGKIGAPGIDLVLTGYSQVLTEWFPAKPSNPLHGLSEWCWRVMHYVFGIAIWMFIAISCARCGAMFARITEVGYSKFCAEWKAEEAKARRLAAIERVRVRRRGSLRGKDLSRQQEQEECISVILVLGYLLTIAIIYLIMSSLST